MYTDGSKKEEGTGGGFVAYQCKQIIHKHGFKMQDSLPSCLDKKDNELKPKYVKILTDSQSALLALNNID